MDQRKVVFVGLLFSFLTTYGQKQAPSLVDIGKRFLGKPYRGHMLSPGNPEKLITSQDAFDCLTFLEHCLATRISYGNPAGFVPALKHVRYAGDSVQYEKRYHYFSDAMWHLGYKVIQDPIHHSTAPKDFSFLSNYLRAQKSSSIDINALAQREKILSKRKFEYTAMKDLSFVLPLIQDGDLIALVGKKNHLDVLHTSMAVRQGNQVHIMHASQEKKKVIISPQTLVEYLNSHKQFIGISVFRPIFNE
ncbi:N-acetylmuramoyl-L-alanine amidase-like domain-containing protein [Aquirufa sp.]|jgi:hypothetical protein|uniref:N-acetylmuramoyl-L-alanine amidase-like domain-containing protein n=1 Tax=Aquirufa sp. TaxID=2676249 RepID=UPI0037BF24E1